MTKRGSVLVSLPRIEPYHGDHATVGDLADYCCVDASIAASVTAGGIGSIMNRNVVFLVIGVLAAATLFLSYQLYEERQQRADIGITVGAHGISIRKH